MLLRECKILKKFFLKILCVNQNKCKLKTYCKFFFGFI